MAASLRDQLLPVVDQLRGLPNAFGMRRFAVTVRRRVWSGVQAGEGSATDSNIAITPPPRVRDITAKDLTPTEAEYMALGTNKVVGQMYRVDKITPRYVASGATGGYLAEQLRLWPNRDTGAVENLVALVGDDGYLRECVQVTFEQDRAFGYSMLVKEVDRPRSPLQSVAISPLPLSIARGKTQQLAATGTHNGGATSILTSLTAWTTSDATKATVDIYGNLTAVAAGSATITATILGVTATLSVTVT